MFGTLFASLLTISLASSLPSLPPHPRLVITKDRVDRIQSYLKAKDGNATQMAEALMEHAVSLLSTPPTPMPTPGPSGILVVVRSEVDIIYTSSLAYALSGNMSFARRGIQELMQVSSNWTTWNPPHFLDVAEMTHGAAVGYDALFDVMSASEKKTVEDAIATFGLSTYLKGLKDGEWWAETTWNWGCVCNGGIAVGALGIGDVQSYASLANETFVSTVGTKGKGIWECAKSYTPAGAWLEGPMYSSYAARLLIDADAALESAIGGDLGIGDLEGLNNSCLFEVFSEAPAMDAVFSWSDCEASSGPHANLFYMARKYNVPACAEFARIRSNTSPLLKSSVNILSRQLLWYTPQGSQDDLNALPLDKVYPDVAVLVSRSSWNYVEHEGEAFFGLKGGDNTWNHGHLSLGNFVFLYSGTAVAIDLGAGSYALPDYFGHKRWDYYRTNSSGHNVIQFDGKNQDTSASASFVSTGLLGKDGAWGVLDMSKAWTGGSMQRGGALIRGRQQVVLRDEISPPSSAKKTTWSMHTPTNVTVLSSTAAKLEFVIASDGRKITTYAWVVSSSSTCPGVKVEAFTPHLASPQKSLDGITKVQFSAPASTCTILSIAVGPMEPNSDLTVNPLNQWPKEGPTK